MSNTIPIKIKHSGKVYPIEINLNETGSKLKLQISSLTNVPTDRQKVLVRGGPLKDEVLLNEVGIKSGQTIMVLGTPLEDIIKNEDNKSIQFIEDKKGTELINSSNIDLPSGLINLGNTCYLNSSIQLLNTIDELKEDLSKSDVNSSNDNNNALIYNIRALFKKMNDDEEKKVTPLNFLTSVRNCFPQFQERSREGFYKQQDAEEAYSQILNSLLNKFPNLKKYFEIEFKTEIKCLEDSNEEIKYGIEDSLKLNCHINSQINFLNDGLKNGLKEIIEKHNDNLNRNAKYEISRKIIKLPKYLTINFVRFYWKRETGKKAKIMRKVQFPFQLDIMELIDDNEKKEKLIKSRDLISKIEKENEEEFRQIKKLKPNQELTTREQFNNQNEELKKMRNKFDLKFKEMIKGLDNSTLNEGENPSSLYELIGIIAHQGASAESGHYQAFIKDENDLSGERWYKFNDDIVTIINKDKIAALAGGSEGDSALVLLYKGVGI
ncbi:deubiquitinating enzyme [Pichia californica]|uniref:Ubiquitin carboxyl-terminal hydrolase n=1 Tax=Pichia californica TaxID=460514 RepID=A0A9P6WMB9_9ASCO|nr:deubiquitinating enzyme [[Candida] californica]KAG0689682.1 deubiquitinating enzyme [[Candida] californica]